MEFTEKMVEKAMEDHIQDYSNFMNDVLDMEMVFGLPRTECIELVIKRYPQLLEN